MALIPNINLCVQSGCTELIFRETTGIYNVTTNPGGYGTPNPNADPAAADSVVLVITSPDGIEYTLDMAGLSSFPNDNTEFEYSIPLSLIGDRTVIEDGYWQFTYTVTFSAVSYSVTKSYFFYCNANCCVSKMLSAISLTDITDVNNSKNNKNIEKYIRVKTLLESIKGAANCGNETQFNKIITLINKFCRNTDCKTCN